VQHAIWENCRILALWGRPTQYRKGGKDVQKGSAFTVQGFDEFPVNTECFLSSGRALAGAVRGTPYPAWMAARVNPIGALDCEWRLRRRRKGETDLPLIRGL
jgi:hypothetical protein